MSLACEILASFLLIFTISTEGAGQNSENTKVIWGPLDHDINLEIPDFQMNEMIADIRWDRNETKVAQFKKDKPPYQDTDTYVMLKNGTLKIRALKRNDSALYKVSVYDLDGKNTLEKLFHLKIQEMVSDLEITWNCTNRTATCKVAKGSDLSLKLTLNGTRKQESGTFVQHKWNSKWTVISAKCEASNNVGHKVKEMNFSCSGDSTLAHEESGICGPGEQFSKEPSERTYPGLWTPSGRGLDMYLIVGICGGGIFFLVLVALLIFYISKRKKQSSRIDDEELEIRGKPVTPEERGRSPYQIPGSTPQNPAMSQAPPVPGHRPQAPTHRPRPPGPRVQHQQKKRAPPTPGTQVHQQKGPPLPKPRVQTKPPMRLKKTHNSVF
ncbi:LOW QUALITY PROTEIN: T-cell surface antigen CD2 [Hippopotamus amphibius kiboko]|uniref:LOW QUALITY PROTEIN: T-cell surface antigen CD2 n=1 Tax=Hippopotamus amphibius kiboko TaxID=575201 RepID=UPI00259731A7|nr:LOW QUALITY PROTEIN: T-cell surface antigen CD2 [Hippopotamus amphibius kiboko]